MFGIYRKSLTLADKLPELRLIRLSARISTPAKKLMVANPLGWYAKAKTIAAINRNTFPLWSQL